MSLAKPGMRTIRGLKAGEESQQVQDLVPVQVHWEEHSKTALCLSFPRSDSTEEETYLLIQVGRGNREQSREAEMLSKEELRDV